MTGGASRGGGPLTGRTIVVTRAKEQSSALASALEAHGARTLAVPLIAIGPAPDAARVDAAARSLGDYHWVAFTSPNGVGAFVRALAATGAVEPARFAGARIAAVGPGTAAALERAGLPVDRVAAEHRGEGLAASILEVARAGERVLLPRAKVARDALPEALREAGIEVDDLPVYENVPPEPASLAPLVEGLRARTVDALTLTSSSTADALADALGGDAPRLLEGCAVCSIGALTTETAERRGLPVAVTAHPHTIDGLVDAIVAHFEKLRVGPDS